jgi:hypothetical protein
MSKYVLFINYCKVVLFFLWRVAEYTDVYESSTYFDSAEESLDKS